MSAKISLSEDMN